MTFIKNALSSGQMVNKIEFVIKRIDSTKDSRVR